MSDKRSCIHCGHAEDAHVDTRGMKGQRQVPWCNDCNSNHIAAHSFHPFMNTERGATFEELDPSSGRYHGHTGGGPNYAGKQWVHQHDGGNMEHEHFRQGVHTRDYHATGYQENVPDKLPPDIRDKDINKSLSDMHSHEDDEQEGAKFHGAHQHLFEEADDHYHTSASGEDVPLSPHKVPGHYCSSCGGASAPRAKAKCGRTDAHTAHGAGRDFCVGNMGNPIAGRTAASPVPDKVPKTWARIKPKKEYPPEITARARYVPGKREAEIGKRVDTILALRHKFHGTATDRMGKSADGGDCKTCGHELEYHPQKSSTAGDSGCTLCACDTYKRERTCVDCQHGVSEHNSTHAYDSQGYISTGCDKCKCIKYREPSVGRWAKPRPRKIATDKRLDTVMALRQKWHGSGHSIIDKSMAEGEKHLDFPESGADLYNHMLTGHGRGTKTGWNLISGAADLENPRMRALLHRLHLADHEKSKRPFVVKAAQRLTLSKARNNTFCADCDHLASEHYREGGEEGCGHLYPAAPLREGQGGRGVTVPGHCEGFRERGEHAHYCEQAMGGKYAGQPGSQPGGKTKCTCPRSEEERATEHTNFGICDCGHAYEAHHWPKVGKQENFCNRGGCNCNGYKQTDLNDPRTRDVPEQLPSDIRDMKINKSHDGGPGPAWDIHTTNEWHGPDCALTEGRRGGVKFHVERWRRNGATKTWKTRPGEFRIPIKNGLRNYGSIDHTDHLYYHPADRCPEEARHETALQVRATDRLPSDIANMKIDKSRPEWLPGDCAVETCSNTSTKCGCGKSHCYEHPHEDEIDGPRGKTRLRTDKLPPEIRDMKIDKSRSTYPCANCDQPFKTRAQLAAHQRREVTLTLSGPRFCRECRADLTGMKAVDIGMHMGGHPEGRRAVVTGLRAGYGGLPERATQEPANGARHRSIHCAFGHHEGCKQVFQTHPKNPAAKAGRKLTCDCRCHPQDKLPDEIRDMDIEKSMHSAGCRSRLVSPCTDEKHGGVDNHCWTAHPLPGGGPCDCGGIERAADRARATLGLQLPERLSPTGRTPNRLPASIRNMSIEKGRRAFCPNCGHMRCADKCADCPSCAKGVGPIGSVEVVSPKSYGPVGAWCKAPSIPDTCHNLGHGLARARATGWAEDDEGWRYGLCSRHVKRPDEYHATMKITGPSEKVSVPDRLPKDFGKSIWRLRKGNDYCGADSDESPEVAEEKLHDTAEASSPREFASTCKKRGSYSGLLAPSGTVYAKPGYQEHENMIDQAHMHHDYHGLVNAHGWARLSTKGANMNIDFNHDVMSRDTAARLHQVASIHGRVNGWTCYGRHRGGWEAGRDGASLAEHLEEEASQKSFRLTQASAGKPPKQTRPHANDRGEWNGKRFWSGSVSRIDGRVEEVHPFRTAQNYDFHHRMYMSPGAIERIDHGDSAFFHIDDHKPQLWSTAEDGSGFGSAVTPGLNKDQLRGHIERQVKIHP